MEMSAPINYRRAHTHLSRNHTEVKHKLPCQLTTPRPPLANKGIQKIQQILGSILYYAQAVDMTVLMALSSIASEQMKATEKNTFTMCSTSRLFGIQLRSQRPFSCFRHGDEYPLGCFIFI